MPGRRRWGPASVVAVQARLRARRPTRPPRCASAAAKEAAPGSSRTRLTPKSVSPKGSPSARHERPATGAAVGLGVTRARDFGDRGGIEGCGRGCGHGDSLRLGTATDGRAESIACQAGRRGVDRAGRRAQLDAGGTLSWSSSGGRTRYADHAHRFPGTGAAAAPDIGRDRRHGRRRGRDQHTAILATGATSTEIERRWRWRPAPTRLWATLRPRSKPSRRGLRHPDRGRAGRRA